MDKLVLILLVIFKIQENHGYPHSTDSECPQDCICYSDYLHNLESWKWVEPDVHYDRDDPEHEQFNPYTEHNEVFENPKLFKKRQKESLLFTVTCMIRNNNTEDLETTLNFIPKNTQVLSLIQAPGSGVVLLNKTLFRKFHSIVGLEVRGYSDKNDYIEIAGDTFADLVSLVYLNLETVFLKQSSVENKLHESRTRILKINYTFNDVETNEITSQLLIISPDKDNDEEADSVVPYTEYRKSLHKEKTAPLEPKFRVAFTGLAKLQHLRISGCNLHDISWDMFYKLENLKYLLLDENDLLFLPDFVFYATSNLSALSLSRNRILNLQTVGLVGLLYLQKLDVTYNNITHLSELSLPPFPHLEVADFRYNPIDSIFPNTFEVMNSTKTLFLGSPTTPLDLSHNSFFGLVSLTRLDIINVKIRLLEKSMLKGMPSLKILQLTGEIPRISYDAFGDVMQLEKIIMRNCGIRKISMDAFFGLTSLYELDLSHNEISFLPPGIFEDQVSLREVFLQHNQLTTLPVNLIENLPVKIIRLEVNPWHCSCEMKNWNPQQINRVKRYHIPPPNTTLCQKMYDKGSMCFETYEPKFEVTYSYEKRVSPVCETPFKFNTRSVFEVIRRELKYCSQQDLTGNGNNQSTEKQITGTSSAAKSFPENYSFNTLKALEKQLLAKPTKVKKNRTMQINGIQQTEQTSQLPGIVSENFSIVEDRPQNSFNIAPELLKFNHSQESISNLTNTQTDNQNMENAISNFVSNFTVEVTPSLVTPHADNSTQPLVLEKTTSSKMNITVIDKFAPLNTRQTISKTKDKKKNKTKTSQRNGDVQNSNDQYPTPVISKKSMKLARSQKKSATF